MNVKKEITHGTTHAYGYHKCRCDACREAHAVANRNYHRRKSGYTPPAHLWEPTHKDYPHGTVRGAENGCECGRCRDKLREYDREAYKRRVGGQLVKPFHRGDVSLATYPHGTLSGYRYGCRCDACRSSHRDYKAEERNKPQTRVQRRASNARRRAQKNGTKVVEYSALVTAIYAACPEGYQVDHIVPLAKGGHHVPANLQYLPSSVNASKGAKVDVDVRKHALDWRDYVCSSEAIPRGSRGKLPEVQQLQTGA